MKKPEDIKKGLEYLSIKDIVKKLDMWKEGIAYDYAEDAALDALSLLQQLEAQNAELLEKTKQLELERDAAVRDLKKARACRNCKHINIEPWEQPCKSCGIPGRNYEWRGPCKENGTESPCEQIVGGDDREDDDGNA